jgi:hypothetical protein
MDCHVTVILKDGESYDFHLTESELSMFSPESAQGWLAREFEAAGCEPTNPVGKVLLVDRILLLAGSRSKSEWEQRSQWVKQFVCAAARAIGRPALTIDTARYSL